jgi:hypothetical protein
MKLITAVVVIVLTLSGCDRQKPGETSLDQLISPWAVDRIEIYKMRSRTEVPTVVSAKMLERDFVCKLEIRDTRVGFSLPAKILYDTYFSVGDKEPDARIGAVLYNKRNERLAAVFFDKSGRNAILNERKVQIRGPLFSWLSNLVSCP